MTRRKKDYKNLAPQNTSQSKWSVGNIFAPKSTSQPNISAHTYTSPKKVLKPRQFSKQNNNNSEENGLNSVLASFGKILISPFLLLWQGLNSLLNLIDAKFNRDIIVKTIFGVLFIGILLHFGNLQVVSIDLLNNKKAGVEGVKDKGTVIYPRRGQVYAQDLRARSEKIPLTTTEYQYTIWYDPSKLYELLKKGDKGVSSIDSVSQDIASYLNLPYSDINTVLNRTEQLAQQNPPVTYAVLAKNVNEDRRKAIDALRKTSEDPNSPYVNKAFINWIGYDVNEKRSYPENSLMAATIGYVQDTPVPTAEVKGGCSKLVEINDAQGTPSVQYRIGRYGVEEKYCDVLGGRNGVFYGVGNSNNVTKQDGADIYLTIDANLQRQAEAVLEESVKKATNSKGGPTRGGLLILNAKTGEVLAMASYPSFNPNQYSKDFEKKPEAFINSTTSFDFEIGSVMKPLTVAAVLNEYYSGRTLPSGKFSGKRAGVSPEFKFTDYGKEGKIYEGRDGQKNFVRNASNVSFSGKLGLMEILRDSINTGISDIVDHVERRRFKKYIEEEFLFGKPVLAGMPGDTSGNLQRLETDIDCPFCYSSFGYGQGFTASMLQLGRAYTTIASGGKLLEPYLVKKIVYPDGRVDDGTQENSSIKRPAPRQILDPRAAERTTEYMVQTIEQGYRNQGHPDGGIQRKGDRARVENYVIAGKSGTAEISEGACNYDCMREKSLYITSYAGFAPAKDPDIVVIYTLVKPNPGDKINSFASRSVAPFFGRVIEGSLNYLQSEKRK